MERRFDGLSDGHSRAVAQIAALCAYMDTSVEFVVSTAMYHSNQSGQFLLKSLTPDRLVELAKHLVKERFPTNSEEVDRLFAEIVALRRERNRIVHTVWVPTAEDADTSTGVTIRPFKGMTESKISIADLTSVKARFEEAVVELRAFEHRLYEVRHSPWWGNAANER